MTTVHRVEIFGRLEDQEPHVLASTGTLVEIDGTEFVRTASGAVFVERSPAWRLSLSDAKRYAAEQLDTIVARLVAKAAALRAEADAT